MSDSIEFMTSQIAAWSSPPVDDVGYIPAAKLLTLPDDELHTIINNMRMARYHGWRNDEGLWRDLMGLDEITGKDVIDWGCGTGVEALELAIHGNRVTGADIVSVNVELAARVLSLHGCNMQMRVLDVMPPFLPDRDKSYDVFYCSGVLHHIPQPEAVMERACQLLRPGGEARLMLYSDIGWRIATGTAPPDDVTGHRYRERFTRFFDDVGNWADWYDCNRLKARFGQWFTMERFSYLTPDNRYCAAIMRKR